MDFQYFGANCIKIDVDKATFLVDPSANSNQESAKVAKKSHVLETGMYPLQVNPGNEFLLINYPGEYELESVAVKGIQTPAYTDVHDSDNDSNTMFTLRANNLSVCVLGNASPQLSDEIYEQIGTVDILIVPVGGGGFTLDPQAANKIIKQIEPNICIATHYEDGATKYEVPQQPVKDFFEELGSGEIYNENKLKIRGRDLEDTMQVLALRL